MCVSGMSDREIGKIINESVRELIINTFDKNSADKLFTTFKVI